MTFKVNVAIPIRYYTGVTGSTVSYKLQDESGNLQTSGSMSESGSITGLYQTTFTPDAAGMWTVIITSGTNALAQVYPVGFGTISDSTYGLSAIHDDLAIVDGLFDVPTADASSNSTIRDIAGNKSDAAVTTVGTVASIVAYVKGLLNQVAAVKAKTDNLPASPATSTDATTAVTTYDLDHITKASYGGTKPTAGSLFDYLFNKNGSQTFDRATDSLEALADSIGVATPTAATHSVTIANSTTETTVFEYTSSGSYSLSVYLDLGDLESHLEGGVVNVRMYNKVDGTNYATRPIAVASYAVGASTMNPSVEVFTFYKTSKVTIQCTSVVAGTRSVPYYYVVKTV